LKGKEGFGPLKSLLFDSPLFKGLGRGLSFKGSHPGFLGLGEKTFRGVF